MPNHEQNVLKDVGTLLRSKPNTKIETYYSRKDGYVVVLSTVLRDGRVEKIVTKGPSFYLALYQASFKTHLQNNARTCQQNC